MLGRRGGSGEGRRCLAGCAEAARRLRGGCAAFADRGTPTLAQPNSRQLVLFLVETPLDHVITADEVIGDNTHPVERLVHARINTHTVKTPRHHRAKSRPEVLQLWRARASRGGGGSEVAPANLPYPYKAKCCRSGCHINDSPSPKTKRIVLVVSRHGHMTPEPDGYAQHLIKSLELKQVAQAAYDVLLALGRDTARRHDMG